MKPSTNHFFAWISAAFFSSIAFLFCLLLALFGLFVLWTTAGINQYGILSYIRFSVIFVSPIVIIATYLWHQFHLSRKTALTLTIVCIGTPLIVLSLSIGVADLVH